MAAKPPAGEEKAEIPTSKISKLLAPKALYWWSHRVLVWRACARPRPCPGLEAQRLAVHDQPVVGRRRRHAPRRRRRLIAVRRRAAGSTLTQILGLN